MRIVTAQELNCWLATGKVLEQDGRGPKVVALANGLFLKIFYTRRHPLLAKLQPAAKRFARNADLLVKKGVAAPRMIELFWLDRQAGLSGCLYEPLPGHSVEQLYLKAPDQIDALLSSLAGFIRHLHRKGIYFRSLHLGNILLQPDHNFGLIDILDLKFKRLPLNRWQIERNFKHLKSYLLRNKLATFPIEELLRHYHQDHDHG